jgi:hypothetical protein
MQIKLRFDDDSHENVQVTELAPGHIRLQDTPLLAPEPVYSGDIIEAEQLPDGTYRYLRVLERAPMRHYSWLVPRSFVESPAYRAFASEIERAGGHWEGVAGGTLHAHLPQASILDAEAVLRRYLSSGSSEA